MQRSYVSEIKTGQEVLLKGWCHEIRSMAKMAFILLRDSSGMVQCIAKDDKIDKKGYEILIMNYDPGFEIDNSLEKYMEVRCVRLACLIDVDLI